MPIKLTENDERIADVCRKAEIACSGLTTHGAWPVKLLEHFRDLPEAKAAPSYASTPAAYRPSEALIYVNGEAFFRMRQEEQLAVLVHEVGHAVTSGDCFEADMFACRHGQEAALVSERLNHYGGQAGLEYATALKSWRDSETARAAFAAWRTKKMMGLF